MNQVFIVLIVIWTACLVGLWVCYFLLNRNNWVYRSIGRLIDSRDLRLFALEHHEFRSLYDYMLYHPFGGNADKLVDSYYSVKGIDLEERLRQKGFLPPTPKGLTA